MTDATAIDWQNVLLTSPVGVFLGNAPKKPRAKLGYDHAFFIDDAIIFVLTAEKYEPAIADDVTGELLKQSHVELANALLKQHSKALKNIPKDWQEKLSLVATQRPDKYDDKELPKVYFVGLVGVSTTIDGVQYCVNHELNHQFFHEDCVFDLDDEATILQAFSWQDWHALLEHLPSASDLLAFLKYHRQALVGLTPFESAAQLAKTFLHDPVYFQRAWQVEKQLQKQDFMVRVSPPIKESVYKKQDSIDALVARQQAVAPLWVKAVERMVARQQAAELPVPWWVVQQLLLQSGYTRMNIIETVLAFKGATFGQKQEGSVSHEHSYHRLGQHFVVVIYGQHPDSDLHAQRIYETHKSILQNIDEQLSGVAVQDLFLLGFDLSKTDDEGNIHVMMDVYYEPSKQRTPTA